MRKCSGLGGAGWSWGNANARCARWRWVGQRSGARKRREAKDGPAPFSGGRCMDTVESVSLCFGSGELGGAGAGLEEGAGRGWEECRRRGRGVCMSKTGDGGGGAGKRFKKGGGTRGEQETRNGHDKDAGCVVPCAVCRAQRPVRRCALGMLARYGRPVAQRAQSGSAQPWPRRDRRWTSASRAARRAQAAGRSGNGNGRTM